MLSLKKILVVDDDQKTGYFLKLSLQKFLNCEVVNVEDGLEALNVVFSKTFIPDLILMDYHMPIMNGLDAASHLRLWSMNNDQFFPIMMITGNHHKIVEINHLVDAVIYKPFKMKEVIAEVKKTFQKLESSKIKCVI